MAEDTKLLMTIPKDVIEAQVRAAVAVALSKDPEALVRAVVNAAMDQKDNRGYSGKTIWEEKTNEMIREVAHEAFRGWLEEQRPKIQKAVLARLKSTGDVVEKIAAKFADKLQSNFSVSVHFKDEDR